MEAGSESEANEGDVALATDDVTGATEDESPSECNHEAAQRQCSGLGMHACASLGGGVLILRD